MERVPTWRETGRFLKPDELNELTEDQRVTYYAESSARSLAEIDEMPEPERSIFQRQVQTLRNRREDRAAS
jgi:hypothetical protein